MNRSPKIRFGVGGARPGRMPGARALLALVAIAVAVIAAIALVNQGATPQSSAALSNHAIESMFQDDQLLIYPPMTRAGNEVVAQTLQTLRTLGVQRLRLTIEWYYIAPANGARVAPAGFDGTNPADYQAASWGPYDRIDRLATAAGLKVDFDVTGPGPLWAMRPGVPPDLALHYYPSATAFGQFVAAVGKRYDGTFSAPAGPGAPAGGALPRVSFWSVWNEPNQPGWLSPQWLNTSGGAVPESARLYRGYVDAAYAALSQTGHSAATDTFLIGELAPEGSEGTAAEDAMTPMPFLRALYCVGSGFQPLRGSAATALGCPSGGATGSFVSANPGLFHATGFAHHPYSFFRPPNATLSDPNFVPLSELGTLEHGLDAIFTSYGVSRQLPLYLTEYGYETNPPNPFRGVSLRKQSLYLDEAEYLAWRDPRVRLLSQFLLQDSAPDPAYPRGTIGYWSTFQTGLEFLGGAPKPSFDAYRLPIFLPQTTVASGGALPVWGMLRTAPHGTAQTARIEWAAVHGRAFREIASITTRNPSGFLFKSVTPPGSGVIRIAWTSAAGQVTYSRSVGVTVAG